MLGAISRVYDAQWNGIVVQAVLLTAGVFFGMLLLYSTHIIKVTDRMRRIVIVATFGVVLVYGLSLLASLFGASISFITGASTFSILFSVAIVGLAAFNLMLDFDFIERGANAGLPEADGVVRGVRPDGHAGVALPRDPEAARQAALALEPSSLGSVVAVSATVSRHG